MNFLPAHLATFFILLTFFMGLSSAYVPRYQKQTTPKPDNDDLYTSEHNRPTAIKYLANPYQVTIEIPVALTSSALHRHAFKNPNTFTKLTFNSTPRRKRYHPLRSFMLAKWSNPAPLTTETGNLTDSKNYTEGETLLEQNIQKKRLIVSPLSETSKVPYDVPQIECPPLTDGTERFSCPSPNRANRYRCIDDRSLCDGFIDCPNGEDEDMRACMFYKTTKAHLDVLADALLRWARGRF